MNYGKAIRLLRASKNISQQQLGTSLKLNSSYVSRIEAGTRVPSTELLEKIAKIFSIPLYLLILLASDAKKFSPRDRKIFDTLSKDLLKIVLHVNHP
jgi:transcriptional regulator with XRE-family HTH domain